MIEFDVGVEDRLRALRRPGDDDPIEIADERLAGEGDGGEELAPLPPGGPPDVQMVLGLMESGAEALKDGILTFPAVASMVGSFSGDR